MAVAFISLTDAVGQAEVLALTGGRTLAHTDVIATIDGARAGGRDAQR
jgi:hypothetical protein